MFLFLRNNFYRNLFFTKMFYYDKIIQQIIPDNNLPVFLQQYNIDISDDKNIEGPIIFTCRYRR